MRWMDSLPVNIRDKCIVRVERLEEAGEALREPESKRVADGVFQLAFRAHGTEYAILYFFYDKQAVIVHGCAVASRVEDNDLALAVDRKVRFCRQPGCHTYGEED